MENLPFDIIPPMRILPLWFVWSVRALVLLAILTAVFVILKYLVPYLKKMLAPPPPPLAAGVNEQRSWDIAESINQIRDQYRKSGEYRDGIVALSALVKSFLEWRSGKQVEEMESSEIKTAIDDAAGAFFSALELKAFGIDEPGEPELNEMSSKALKLVSGKKGSGKINA